MAVMCLSQANTYSLKFVLALFWQTGCMLGVVKCLGLFLADINVALELTARDNGVMFGVYSAAAFSPGSIIAYLYNHNIGRRALVLTGAVFISTGVILASLSMNNAFLVTTIALSDFLSGLGNSLLSTCVIIGLSEAETEHFSTFYGIGKSGYAFGTLAWPLLGDFLLRLYGWRSALYIIGALLAHIVPIALLLDFNRKTKEDEALRGNGTESRDKNDYDFIHWERDVPRSQCHKEQNLNLPLPLTQCGEGTIDESMGNVHLCCSDIVQLWKKSVFYRDPCQIIVILCHAFLSMVDGSWYAFVIPRAIASGISTSDAVYIAFSTAVASFFSRGLSGAVTRIINPSNVFLAGTILNIISLTIDSLFCTYSVTTVSAFLTSFSFGSRGTLIVLISKDRAPMTDFPFLLALGDLASGLGMFFGSFLVGTIITTVGSYHESFWLLVAVEILVFFMMLPPRFIKSPLAAQ
ncbi:monocarboxylate transporter 12-like [Diadema setosum]|uniref:monocarboxylate transporter 12-like n=1 Tax=Diadema setosum TaxID=31175 RepID=UPI003B3B826C